jgi:hypothetical protein
MYIEYIAKLNFALCAKTSAAAATKVIEDRP